MMVTFEVLSHAVLSCESCVCVCVYVIVTPLALDSCHCMSAL